MRRVVVTGMGIISPVGLDVASAWDSLIRGRSGIRYITRFDASGDEWHVKIAGEAWGFDATNYMSSKDARVDCIANVARERAIDAAMSSAFGFGGHNSVLVFRLAVKKRQRNRRAPGSPPRKRSGTTPLRNAGTR